MARHLLSRREFLHLLAIAAASYPVSSLAATRTQTAQTRQLEDPWLTLSAVQEHLFPAGPRSPGARDIRALEYLQGMLESPDIEDKQKLFIRNGVGWLNDLAVKQQGQSFVDLGKQDKEKILRRIESSRAGERWLSLLLSYLLEALLADPVYDGNPEGIGWAWLQHQPGYPTPPPDKKYFKLGKIRYRRTKA